MPFIRGPSITDSGGLPAASSAARHSSVSATTKSVIPLTRACESALRPAVRARRGRGRCPWPGLRDRLGKFDQRLAGIGAAVQHHVLDLLAQYRVEVVIDAEHAGVDDAHRQSGLDRVVEEDGVDRFAHRIVAAEREGDVGDAAGNLRARQVRANPGAGLDEVDGVVVVLFDAGGDGEDVRVEDDVLGRESRLLGEQPVGARADFGLAGVGVGLARSRRKP
jgi:predicted GNAT family acetyltransferase